MATNPSNTKQAWDRQWRGNLISTCIHHMDRDTSQAIGQGWGDFFKNLPEGAAILDVGTGNGVLPLTALMVSETLKKGFDIHGTDMAAIDPAQAVAKEAAMLKKIHFHGDTPTERLPFEDNTFDAVTGQHALEYGDLEKSVAEITRVLKPGGKVRFLMHAAEGEVVKANLCKIEQCRYVLEDAKLFELADQAVTDALKGGAADGAALKAALGETSRRFEADPVTSDLSQLLELLWGAYEQRRNFPDLETFKHWLSENRAETKAQMVRIQALEKAALSGEEAEQAARIFKAEGLDVAVSAVNAANGRPIGWLLEG